MNAINLDITDYLRNYNSYASHSKFCTQQALSRKYCRLLSRSRQKTMTVCDAKSYLRAKRTRIKFYQPGATKEPHLRRDDFAHLFGEIIAHDVFGRINEHLAAVADPQNQPLGVFQRRVAKGEVVNFINFLAT